MIISKYAAFRHFLLAATIIAGPLGLAMPTPARAQVVVGISVQIAPPLLPVYVQPPMPEIGYIWTPGYWAYADGGYYWVPGTWVQPPVVGVLWTPPYWGWSDGAYLFHDGYWGPHVGFYGGVNYGYGYGGSGYDGGRWDGGSFAYNRSVNNFGSVQVQHVYEHQMSGGSRSNISYAGGTGGIRAEPTAAERAGESERHTPVTAEQARHISAAASNPTFAASHNNGHPAIAATSRPAVFEGAGAGHVQPGAAAGRVATPAAVAHPAARAGGSAAGAPTGQRAAAHPAAAQVARPAAAQAAPHQVTAPTAQRPAAAQPAQRAAARPAAARPAAQPAQHAAARPAEARPAARAAAPQTHAAPRPAAAPARAEEHVEKR